MSYRNGRSDGPQSKVYVGDLGNDANERELEDAFGQYGTIKKVWVAQNPPGFAFVEFEDTRDAEDAIKALDGTTICGRRAKVEMARGGRRRGGGGGGFGGRRGGYGGGGDDSCYQCGGRGHFARECRSGGGGGGGGYRDSRRRSRSPY